MHLLLLNKLIQRQFQGYHLRLQTQIFQNHHNLQIKPVGLASVNKRAYLDKLTPSQLKEAYLNEKNNNYNIPFSQIVSSMEGKLCP
jgi:hypothetical protein